MFGTRLKTVLRLIGMASSLMAISIAVACLAWPLGISDPEMQTASSKKELSTERREKKCKPSIQDFEPFLKRKLRSPLIDPPKKNLVETKPKTRKKPMPKLRLLGIAFESGNSLAIISTQRGEVELKGVGDIIGDELNGPTISAIEDQRIVICCNGENITLDLEEGIRR